MSSVQSFLQELQQNYERPKKHRRSNKDEQRQGVAKSKQRNDNDSLTKRQQQDVGLEEVIDTGMSDQNKVRLSGKRKKQDEINNQHDDSKKRKEKKNSSKNKEEHVKNKRQKNRTTVTTNNSKHSNQITTNESSLLPLHSEQQQQQKKQLDHHDASPSLNPNLPPHKYILAPMVGASELAFRLLCRKYGAEIAYTPMMNAEKFVSDPTYQQQPEYRTCPIPDADHPIVAHFASNEPNQFAAAAREAVHGPYKADAIDLNLGCPQRTAYVGHFGSYLLDKGDRQLVCDMIRAAVAAVPDIPIFCKIRLLPSIQETIEFVQQVKDAGVSLVAIHARYRASWERTSASARDGPALLEQITQIRLAVPDLTIIANGNTISWDDVNANLQSTTAHGIMSAEGLLDNPALFLPRYGSREERNKLIQVWSLEPKSNASTITNQTTIHNDNQDNSSSDILLKKKKKLLKKLKKIQKIQTKVDRNGLDNLNDEEKQTLSSKDKHNKKLAKLEKQILTASTTNHQLPIGEENSIPGLELKQVLVPLGTLYDVADDKVKLVLEYLDLATAFPVIIRSVVFHVRRIIKDELVKYQLLEDCIKCENITEVRAVVNKVGMYRDEPDKFVYDQAKAAAEKEALDKRKREESKRKDYEARMIRKAKREGKSDLSFYLSVGATVPTIEDVQRFKDMSRSDVLPIWKVKHSQHCMAYHLDTNKCQRGRTCAFLHVDATTTTSGSANGTNSGSFVENDEVAG